MAHMIPDEMDFAAYEQATEFKAKVRPASIFLDDLDAEFEPSQRVRAPAMRSTKLRNAIEFRPGEVSVWAGFNGHKKSMFTGQMGLDLIEQEQRTLVISLDLIDQGQKTLVISLEMPPRKTLARMCRQACATNIPDAGRRREFMAWTDNRLWLFDHVGRLTPQKCMAVCRYFADELLGAHVFIDSFMKVCASEENMDEQKAMVGDLCDLAKETGLHLHLIAHCRKPSAGSEDKPPTKYDVKGSGAITDQPHNVLMVWDNKVKRAEAAKKEPRPDVMAQPDAMVVVEKQRNGSTEGKFSLYFDDRTLRFCDDATSAVEAYDMEGVLA